MYNKPDHRKDRARQALTQQGRCNEHIHSGKAGTNAEKDTGFVKQKLLHVCRQKNSSMTSPSGLSVPLPSLLPSRGIYGGLGSWPCSLLVVSSHHLLPPHCTRSSSQNQPPLCMQAAGGIQQHLCTRGPAGEEDVSLPPFLHLPSRQHL